MTLRQRRASGRIPADQFRVSGKERDDLQAVQQLLRGKDLDVALQFDNHR